MPMTPADLIAASAVAFYFEPTNEYLCRTCAGETRMLKGQAVWAELADEFALTQGLMTCTRCQKPIGHDVQEDNQ